MATGRVCVVEPPRKISELKKSFHTMSPARMATVPVAGDISGSTTRKNVCVGVAPSMTAASSYSVVRPRKKLA